MLVIHAVFDCKVLAKSCEKNLRYVAVLYLMQLTIYGCYYKHYAYIHCSFTCVTDSTLSLKIQDCDPAAQITIALIQLINGSTNNIYACP